EVARRRLPRGVFEYIDRGAEEEVALADNRTVFRNLKLRTKFLVDLTERDMGTELLGKRTEIPMAIAPTGVTGLTWYQGEVELARAATAAGIPYTLGTTAITSIETVAREVPDGRLWFQLYMWKDTELSYQLVGRAKDAGFETLIVTIDQGLGHNREYNDRNGFSVPFKPSVRAISDILLHPEWMSTVLFRYLLTSGMPRHENYPEPYAERITKGAGRSNPMRHLAMTWDDIAKLREFWPGKLIVKGILRAGDAELAVENGADGIVVSNHGGRHLDSSAASLEILPEVVDAVGGKTEILLDSGIRRGGDIAKAVALGAKAVLTGRATLYGTATAGQAGAEKALAILKSELEKTMAYIGCRKVSELNPDVFAPKSLRQLIG
ncbi:MAG TPA: alpha-hydroxy acid oxidase, partial [Alphaproteobacteria bacterium]|nr:alpha-hydroxy acid oxidase [Alphaproteobacteria bacterium]